MDAVPPLTPSVDLIDIVLRPFVLAFGLTPTFE